MPDEDYMQCLYTPEGVFTKKEDCEECLTRYRQCASTIPYQCTKCAEYCDKLCDINPFLESKYCDHVCGFDNSNQCITKCLADLDQSQIKCRQACTVNCSRDCTTFLDSHCRRCAPVCRRHCVQRNEAFTYVPASAELLLLGNPFPKCKQNNTDCMTFENNTLQWRYETKPSSALYDPWNASGF